MATEAETKEPMSETVDLNNAVNTIENSVGGKQENECHQPRNGTSSEKNSEVKVKTETEAADKHAIDISEKTAADNTTLKDIGGLTEEHIEEKGDKFHDETVNDKLEEEKIEANNGNLKDENVNYSISNANQSEKGSTNGPTEINASSIPKRETAEKEEENLEEVIEGKEVETQAGDNKMQDVESISIAEPTEVEQNPDTNVLACQETEDDNQNKDDEPGGGGYDSSIDKGVSQSPLILQETRDHEDVSRTKNEREIDETINYQGTTEENVQTEKTNTDNPELDVEAVEIDKEYHEEMSEDKEVLIQDQLESDIGETEIVEVNNAKGHSIETSRINLDGDVGENDCQLKSEDKFESFDVYEIAKEEEEIMPSEDTDESILESSSITMEETAVKEDEENIDESKDIPTLTTTTQVENVQENGTNSSYDDQTNESISLSNGVSQDEQKDEQDEFTSLKIGNEIQTEPKLYETDDITETSGANSFKDKESMERDTVNSVEKQLQQNSSDVFLDSLNDELEIETEGEIPINETVKEDTSNASTGAPSIFTVEVSQWQVEGINAIDTKDEENIDGSKDIPTLTKTTQVEYDDQTDAIISLINDLSQDEQKDKQDEFTSPKIGHKLQTEPKLYETDDTIETSCANSFKDKESMERNTLNSVEKQLQQNSSDVFLDSLNAELEIETEGEIPINESVKEDTSNASTGAPSIFAVEVSQDQGEESNAIDTKVSEEKTREIGLATLDETLSTNTALQQMDVHDDYEYKEDKLETKLLQEELEDKSIKKETGTGAEQEFYEASETMENKETEAFKESVATERNVEKETLDGPHFHESVTEAEDTHVNEMEKETLKAKKDKESNDEDSKDTISNISENTNLHESPALITYDMEGADIQIADDLIQKPEKEEADNVMAQKDIDESLVLDTSTSNDTGVKARTASENECKEKNEIIASSENNKLEEEQLATQHITEAKQESFNTSNANEMEEDEGFKDKESIEENISEKEILEDTEHEKSPHVILEDPETTTETKGIQDTEFENQGIENEDNGKKIEALVPGNAEAIPSDSTLKEDIERLANQLPEKEEAIHITTEEDNLLVCQLPKETADSNASLKIDSESENNRYIGANVKKEKFEDAAKEKENDKSELAQIHVENEVSEPDEIIIAKENEIAEKENCSTNILSQSKVEITAEPIIASEHKIRSCSSITVTKGGHPSEEEYKIEAAAAEDDHLQEQMIEKKEEKGDMNKELKDYKVEPNNDMKTMEEGEEDRSIEENNNTENIITEELDVYPKLQEEQKEEHNIENEMLAEKTTYKSCDVSESNENKSNKEKETEDDELTFEQTNKTENSPEVTSITENVIREEEDFHTRLQEEEQNEPLHMENEKLVENTTYESCDASESNETECTKEKERAKKDILNPEGPEITTEAGNIHESEIADIDAYNEDNPQRSEDVISETERDPDDQNTNSIQTTDSKLSEKARESELGPQINTETPCDTMDATYDSLDKEMQNDFEAVEYKIHSNVDVIHVSENDGEKKEVHSSLQNNEVEGEPHTEQELYEESKYSETNENEVFENKENTEKIDSEEDKSEGKKPDLSSRVPFVNSDVLAETKDCNHIKPEKQEPVTIHEASFNKEEEYVMVEEANFEIQHVNRYEETMEEEDTTPEHLSHQMTEKEATITADQEASAKKKSSNEKEIEDKDISEYKIADKNDNVNEIETEKQYAQIDDEHNLQKGEDIMLIKSTTETEPDDESTDSTHTIDRETHTEKVNNVVIESPENNIQHAPEVIEDAVQNSCVELENSDNNDKEKEEINIISQNKEEVIKPLETANERKLGQAYNGTNNEEDTQKGEDTTEFNDEKHVRKEEDTMLVQSAITEESGNESNTLVSGTDGASAFEEAKEDELASQNDVEMTHANALYGNEDPLHKNIENDNRVLDEKILSETSEEHENKNSIERNLIVEESAKIAAVNQEKDQDEEHIEESEMDQSDGKVEQSKSTVKMGIENTEINTALSEDDMNETAHAELLNEGKAELDVGVVPVDRVKGNNDQSTEQSKMLSNDTGKETDDSFSKISNYWPINYNDEASNVNKMETLKVDEKTKFSLPLVHDEDMLQDRSLQDPELNQPEQVKETEQLVSTKASAEVENDNLQEENLPFSQFLMKHILMNDSDSVKTSYDEKFDISKHVNDKREDDIDISKEDEELVPSSRVEKIHHASIVDDGAGFHEKRQENIEVQVDDNSDEKDNSEVADNEKEMLTTKSPISVLEQTQYTSILEDKAINENPQETNKVQVADDCDVKDNSKVIDNRLGNFPTELPKSAVEQAQHTSKVEDKTINKNAQKNTEIQVDDECDVKNNLESTDNIKETFTMQSPISVIEHTQYASIAEHKAINEKPQGTDEVQLDDKCDVNDDSKVTDDKKEFSSVGLPITVDNSMTEHKFDTCIHDEEFMQNDVDTEQNGKPKDNVVAENLLNSYDPVQAEISYGVTSDSETISVKSEDKDINISNTLSEKSIPAVKEEEDIQLISKDREIKEDNPNLLMDEQIFGKTLDGTIAEKKSQHKKDCNELKAENSEIIEDEKEERMQKNGLEDEITAAGLQKDQQSNIAVEPETALGENNLECNQDMHKYEKENEKEQKKFEAPTLSEGKVNSEIKPVENVEDNQDIFNQKNDSTEEQSPAESQKAQEVDENNTDDEEDENQEVDEHKGDDSIHDQTINVESRDIDVTPTKKKSHGILSGVGSKFKRSIIKVKKAMTGKSSHSETQSAK